MKSKLPKTVNAFLRNFGSSVFDFIFSPRFDQTNMARIPPLVVMLVMVKMPTTPPPKSSKNFVINMNTMAHSLPFTYCINTPVLNPNLGTTSGKFCIFSERPRYKIPKAIKNMNNEPMMSITVRTVPSSSKESTAIPQMKCMEMKPKAIPAISGKLLFFPCTTA